MSINLSEYQRQVQDGLFVKSGVDPLVHCALGLAGEAGEVADLVKKSHYVDGRLDEVKLVEELGDVLWYLTSLVDQIGWTITGVAFANIVKLERRHGSDKYCAELLKMVKHV